MLNAQLMKEFFPTVSRLIRIQMWLLLGLLLSTESVIVNSADIHRHEHEHSRNNTVTQKWRHPLNFFSVGPSLTIDMILYKMHAMRRVQCIVIVEPNISEIVRTWVHQQCEYNFIDIMGAGRIVIIITMICVMHASDSVHGAYS